MGRSSTNIFIRKAKDMEKVSVLVPIYGVEKYIGQCAHSLFSQTYADIEYIFVDDCSTDRSLAILEEAMKAYPGREADVKVMRHKRNQGVGAARKTACQAATGSFVMFVDADDFLPLTAVEELTKEAKRSQADIIDGSYAEWRDGRAGETIVPPKLSKEKYLRRMLCQNIVSNRLWGRLYRRSLLVDNHIDFAVGINYGEDFSFITRAMFHARRSTSENLAYYYRMDNAASYTHAISKDSLISFFKGCQLVASFFEEKDIEGKYGRALDVGIVNVYRCAAEHGIGFAQVEEICTYRAKDFVCRLCIRLLKRGWSVKAVNYLYLAYRRFCF